MAKSIEVLITGDESRIGTALLKAATGAAYALGLRVEVTQRFAGRSEWLCLWGVGDVTRDAARRKQIQQQGEVACWDLGYIGQGKEPGVSYVRVSVDHNHPWRDLDRTPSDGSRMAVHDVTLRDDFDSDGPVIVIGMGPKSREHLGLHQWEIDSLNHAKARFPERKVLYRPKPRRVMDTHINWPLSDGGDIAEALRGASLVICRHSNVAVDACVAGVPVECEDGAAFWLYRQGSNPLPEARQDFLNRLAWWQWRTDEQREAWTFLQMVCA